MELPCIRSHFWRLSTSCIFLALAIWSHCVSSFSFPSSLVDYHRYRYRNDVVDADLVHKIPVKLRVQKIFSASSSAGVGSDKRKTSDDTGKGSGDSTGSGIPSSATATVIKCEGLSKSYTGTPQFEQISFNVRRGQRIGLIGINGAGKTTLLKCISGIESADSGVVESLSNTNIVYVDQEPEWQNMKVYQALFEGPSAAARATRKYYQLIDPSGGGGAVGNDASAVEGDSDLAIDSGSHTDSASYAEEFSRITDALESSNGWDFQSRGLLIAEKLNIAPIDAFLYRDVSELSGGEKKRVGLAAALLKQPDVLLLDEPTNHLDIDALEWLADFLRPGNKGNKDLAMMLVTHDRFFLERVSDEIIELDRGGLFRYPGSYSKYLQLKAERLVAEDALVDRARSKLRKEREWMLRQPQGRQAKSKARQDQFHELVAVVRAGKSGATGTPAEQKMLLQGEKEKQQRLGGVVAEFKAARYVLPVKASANAVERDDGNDDGVGDRKTERVLLHDFTYSFRQRDRIGIVGANGVGKSTFLKILSGHLQPQSGPESVRVGDTVRIGYYEQNGLQLTAEQQNMPVMRFVQEAVDKGISADIAAAGASSVLKDPDPKFVVEDGESLGRRKKLAGKTSGPRVQIDDKGSDVSGSSSSAAVSEKEARALLNRFLFPSHRWFDKVGQLSGGERRRLQLLQVLARKPNFLLLDEPSNDLDIATLSALEEYITEVFKGCLVVVSHDHFFVNRVADHLFVFQGDGIVRDFQGSYTEYLEYRKQAKESEPAAASIRPTAAATGAAQASKSPSKAAETTSTAAIASSTAAETTAESPADVKASQSTPTLSPLSFNERKEMNRLEQYNAKLESQIAELEEKLTIASASGTDGYSVLNEMSQQLLKLKAELDEKENRWLELAERA